MAVAFAGTSSAAGQLTWSESRDGLQIALEVLPGTARTAPPRTRVHFRNQGRAPLTLLHPDTLLAEGPESHRTFRRALEVQALDPVTGLAHTPGGMFSNYRTEPVGVREALLLQPGETVTMDRGEPRAMRAVQQDWPGEVEVIDQAYRPGQKLMADYANALPQYLGIALWQGQVNSPARTWKASTKGDPASPVLASLKPRAQRDGWQLDLTLTNQGTQTVFARLTPSTEGQPLLSRTGRTFSDLARDSAQNAEFPRPEHQVILGPGESRTWSFPVERLLGLEIPGSYELRLQARLHWQAASDWHTAAMLSMLPTDSLLTEPVDLRRQASLTERTPEW